MSERVSERRVARTTINVRWGRRTDTRFINFLFVPNNPNSRVEQKGQQQKKNMHWTVASLPTTKYFISSSPNRKFEFVSSQRFRYFFFYWVYVGVVASLFSIVIELNHHSIVSTTHYIAPYIQTRNVETEKTT